VVIWDEQRDRRGRPLRQSIPDLGGVGRRKKRIEEPTFVARINAGAGHHLLPIAVLVPLRMFESPDPKTRREIDDLHVRLGSLRHGGMIAWPPARNCQQTGKTETEFDAQFASKSDRNSTTGAFAGLFVVVLTTREWAVLGSNQ